MTLLPATSTDSQKLRLRLILLIGQSFTLGILLALLMITANALFLTDFGAATLPYVYLVVAILGSLVSYGSAQLQRRWSLLQVAISTMTAVILFFILAWLARTNANARWVSFALIAAFPLLLQIGFVLLGGQAGHLLDVRQIRRLFPQIVTGFVIGFIFGGLILPFLDNLLGNIENIMLMMALSSLIILLLMRVVSQQFPDAFRLVTGQSQRQSTKSLPQLLNRRFVRRIFLYQMLLAMLIQLTDFLVLAQASARYASSEAIAQFFSNFAVILNVTDLLFLLLIAAYFLGRFGLKAGLLANPAFLLVNFGAMIVAGFVLGVGSTLFFILVVVARIMTITLTDGTTRTAINAVYQAMPAQERTLVQTGAEGIGAPLALGFVGLVLLLFNAISGLSIIHIALFTFLLVVLWSIVSIGVYGDYAAALMQRIKRRALDDVPLTLNDGASLTVVNQLLQSDQLHEVKLALDMLDTADHPSLPDHLLQLADNPNPEVQIEGLMRIEARQLRAALPLVTELVETSGDTAVRGQALRTLCALSEAEAVNQVKSYLNHAAAEIKQGALVGLLRYGGIPGILAAGPHLTEWQQSSIVQERVRAASIIGEVQAQSFYEPLLSLLEDEAKEVRQAALAAVGQIRHPRLLPLVIHNLHDATTRSAAMATLLTYGQAILPITARALAIDSSEYSKAESKWLLRVCGQIGGSGVITLLRQHIQHPDGDIQDHILAVLNLCSYQAQTADRPIVQQTFRQQVSYGANLLAAQQDSGEGTALAPLHRALADECNRVHRRLFLLLSFLYDSRAILRAEAQLAIGSEAERALAMELLDITLSTEEKGLLFPLIDPQLSLAQRLQTLAKAVTIDRLEQASRLAEIIANDTAIWGQSWLQACAIFAAAKLGIQSCLEVIEVARRSTEPAVQETAVWALSILAPDRYPKAAST